jgi:outer membrane protein assembly factor BamB
MERLLRYDPGHPYPRDSAGGVSSVRRVNILLVVALLGVVSCSAGSAGTKTACSPSNEVSRVDSRAAPSSDYDVAHTGVQPGPGPAREPTEVWRFNQSEPIHAIRVGDEGLVVSAGTGLYILDPLTGRQLSSSKPSSPSASSTVKQTGGPSLLSGRDIISTGTVDNFGVVYSFDLATGRQKWNYSVPLHLLPVPIPTLHVVYVSTGLDANPLAVSAVDADTGAELWQYKVPQSEFETMTLFWMFSQDRRSDYLTVGNHVLVLDIFASALYGLQPGTGQRCWRSSIQPYITAAAFADETLFVTSTKGLYALDAATGKTRWKSSGKSGQSAPAVADGVVYVGGDDGSLYAVGARSGDQKWAFETGDFSESAPSVADGAVYAVSSDGVLYALSVASGTRLWSHAVPVATFYHFPPVVLDGMVYVVSDDEVVALG